MYIDEKIKNTCDLSVISAMRRLIDNESVAQLYVNGTGTWERSVRSYLDSSNGVKSDDIEQVIYNVIDWVNRSFSDSFRLEHWSIGKPEPIYLLAAFEAFDNRSCVLTEAVEDFLDRRLKGLMEKAEYFDVCERIRVEPQWACERLTATIGDNVAVFEEFSSVETYYLCLIAGNVADLEPLDVVFDDAFLSDDAEGSDEFVDDKTEIVWDLLEQIVFKSMNRISDERINEIIQQIASNSCEAEAGYRTYLEGKRKYLQ